MIQVLFNGLTFLENLQTIKIVNAGKMKEIKRRQFLGYMMAGSASAITGLTLRGVCEDMGLLIADRSPYYYWRGQQFDSMTTGKDGTIFLGESERRSHLFLFIPPNTEN